MSFASRVPSFTPARPEEILKPAKPWFVVLTLVLAFLANTLPATGVALALKPDFVALTLLYWCIQAPRYVGVGVSWTLGLVMDVVDATLFGLEIVSASSGQPFDDPPAGDSEVIDLIPDLEIIFEATRVGDGAPVTITFEIFSTGPTLLNTSVEFG